MQIRIKKLLGLCFLASLIILLPFVIRYYNGNPLFVGGEFYYNLRVSEDLSNKIFWDVLRDSHHKISFFNYVFSFFIMFLGKEFFVIVPLVLGIISLISFFYIGNFFLEENKSFYSSAFFVFSPIFIFLFSGFNQFTLAVCLSLLSILLFLKKSYWSIPFFVLTSITSISFFILNIILMLFYSFYKRRKKLFLLNLFFGVVSLLIFFYFHNLSEIIISDFSYEQYFTAFGAEIGLSFFYFLIGLIGLFSIWKRRRGHHYFLMTIFLFFILSLFNSVAKIFLNFFLSVLSAIFLLFLIKRTWAVPNIKRFTLLLIICGVIFSTALYSDQLIKSKPGKELVKGLVFLKDEPTAVVLSHEKNNFFIEYFSNKKTLLQSKDSEQIREKIFVSRNLKETTAMLNDKRINYILITGEMKEGLVWDKPQEGLLFLLENSKHFSKKYHSNEVEIWFFLD